MDRNSRRRLLLVAYEFPPAAEGSVQRIARFASLLAEHGWDVDAITAEPVRGQPRDDSLLALIPEVSVTRLPALNISAAVARTLKPLKSLRAAARAGDGPVSKARTASPLSNRVSRWLSVPDDARLWSFLVPRAAARAHAERAYDAILACTPPYSAAVAAARVAKRLGVPLVVDFQDPWRDNANIHWPTRLHAACSERLERYALSHVRAVSAVSRDIVDEVVEMGAAAAIVLPNGFDALDVPAHAPTPGELRLVFLGRLSPVHVDPGDLFEAMAAVRARGGAASAITLDVYGPDAPWAADAARAAGLEDVVRFHGFVSYAEALQRVARADIGVMVFADRPGALSIYTSKLFDYLGVGLPIVLYGPPHSAAAGVVGEYGGIVVPHGDRDTLTETLASLAEAKAARGTLPFVLDDTVRMRFDRRRQVAELAAVLDRAVRDGAG